MSMNEILDAVREFAGVLELAPTAGSNAPSLAWGDHFFYYAPDGELPSGQPYATVVTKNYPDDDSSDLDGPDRWRVNVHVGRGRLTALLGYGPREIPPGVDYAEADVLLPHPVYASLGWLAVVTPGNATLPTVLDLLREAHDDARRRATRHRPGS
ncbi:DUF6194 family protein [Georgenia sp. H159]|uniref:DUF6194 family protein n=1 Tax=Georgenia sp. H159 TaxID=3076115 RepID=UPI002D77E9B6|nr:DUF6194 family protein [Georgenia sp. H159]